MTVRSPIRYAGGKTRTARTVMRLVPGGTREMVSPFFGGGSVELTCAALRGIKVHGSDLFAELANYWQVQLDQPGRLADRLSLWAPDRETYAAVKARLKAHWDGDAPMDDPVDRAAHYWFNHNLSYGPQFLGWPSSVYMKPEVVARLLDRVREFRAPGVSVANMDFADALAGRRDVFAYCDPPYYLGGESRMFRGIYPNRNFPVHHDDFPHERLRDMLADHRGGFVLSYNDCPEVRDLYAGFRIMEAQWAISLGQGETRIGKNRQRDGATHVKPSHEIVVIGESRHG